MKKILFMRHAKSVKLGFNLQDHDRPLDQKGISDVEIVSMRLKKNKIIPGEFISSSALRALETATITHKNLNPKAKLEIDENIYYNSRKGIEKAILKANNKVNLIAFFGHNPTFNNIYADISNSYYEKFPTCAVVLCRFNVNKWIDFSIKESTLEYYDYPNKK